MEGGLPSTYFVIPRKDNPGRNSKGPAPKFRAAKYEAQQIVGNGFGSLQGSGVRSRLHGIDAWRDSFKGREELETIRSLTGNSEIGVRMHWLYYDQQSPATLEAAGAAYDSTMGYNETVGYRAGTMQVFKPMNTDQLLELPLLVMDTALFYPDYLDLSPQEAKARLSRIVDGALQFGGCLTINWHDRSLAPERLWGGSYQDLIEDLKNRGAWFATAGQAVAWFRKRRSAAFEPNSVESGAVRNMVTVKRVNDLPGLRLRIHNARKAGGINSRCPDEFDDVPVDEIVDVNVPSEARR